MEDNGQLIQVIIGVLIGAAYVVAAIVKKIDAWIQTNRMPPEQRRKASQPVVRHEAPQGPLPDLKTILMQELEKALETEKPAPPEQLPEPHPSPLFPQFPAHTQKPASAAIAPPVAQTGKPPKPRPRPKAAPATPHAAHPPAGIRIRRAELLREPSDMGRAIILHEILSPPLSVRKRQASTLSHRI